MQEFSPLLIALGSTKALGRIFEMLPPDKQTIRSASRKGVALRFQENPAVAANSGRALAIVAAKTALWSLQTLRSAASNITSVLAQVRKRKAKHLRLLPTSANEGPFATRGARRTHLNCYAET